MKNDKIALLTNDDGIHSPGWRCLYEMLSEWCRVFIIVPEYEQSGKGVSITLNEPLRIRKHEEYLYTTNGTPADCVNLGINVLLKGRKPDLLISGINKGLNVAQDLLYSGTFGAAMEGYNNKIISFAVSLDYKKENKYANYEKASKISNDIILHIIENIQKPFLYNINLPFQEKYYSLDRIRISRIGKRQYEDAVLKRSDPRNRPYYWYSGNKQKIDMDERSDINLIRNGYISITPVEMLDIDKEGEESLKALFKEIGEDE